MKQIIRITFLALLLSATLPCALPASSKAQQNPDIDAAKIHARAIYDNYKSTHAQLLSARPQLRLHGKDVSGDAQAGTSSFSHLGKSGYAEDMRRLKEKISSLEKRLADLERTWDKKFSGTYGNLAESLNTTKDKASGIASDPILRRLNYLPIKPANAAEPVWVLLPPAIIYKSSQDNLADYSVQEGSASRGGITATETVNLDKTRPPEVRSGFLTWSFTNKPDLSILKPGEKLKWTATIKDTSSNGNVLGSVKFEVFGMHGKSTSGGGDIFYEAPPNGGNITKLGEVSVPAGAVGDKIMLRGKVQAGRCCIVYDDVYQLKKLDIASGTPAGKAKPVTTSDTKPNTGNRSRSEDGKSIIGNWNSQWGPVQFSEVGRSSDGLLQLIKGSWQQSGKGRGVIESGTFEPHSGVLEFTYFQPWNDIRGIARLRMSGDGRSLSGTFTQPPAYTGAWEMSRP